MDWTDLAQDIDMWQATTNKLNLWVSQNVERLSVRQETTSFSGRTLLYAVKQSVGYLSLDI